MKTQNSPEIASQWQRDSAKSFDKAFQAQLTKSSFGMSPISMLLAYADWGLHLAASPGRQMLLAQHATTLLQQPPAVDADGQPAQEKDARFSDSGWSQWPFNAMKKRYQAREAWWTEAIQVEGVSEHNHDVVSFFTRQWLDALSPSNFMATNPEVLRKGRESKGQSWLKGYQRYARDMLESQHKRVSTEALAPLEFEVGKEVALTPGKVVFRNHLIELIQYTPTTEKVYPEPLLIVPSCIMKYYILDLSKHNSMVRYLVGEGHTVFMVSWRNPDASDRELSMQDYVQSGVMQAMAAVKESTKAPRIHALGYCLGGTFLAIAAAALGHRKAKSLAAKSNDETQVFADKLPKLASVTLLASQTDFTEPGELGVFIDDDQLKTLRQEMARTGYLSGRQMAGSFQFLHSRDLIWSRNTRRYLLGQDESGNDLMSWNADVTRLPERMHSQALSSLYLNNELASGRFHVEGVGAVTLKDIKAPMLVVGTVRDHVSPWKSVYKLHLLTDTHMTFILAAGGHNAGIVSEPGHPHRSYQIDSVEASDGWTDPDKWVTKAPLHEGSWWPAMHTWLHDRSGATVPAPAIDPALVLCDAPGEYVMVRYAD
ncbi:MAG: alpha/beta fold hydrolase [Polaromonas sp.]